MRGDKGVKNVEQLSAGSYLRSGLRLLAPELPLFAAALLLLLANSAVRIVMPNFQGEILDGVVTARVSPAAPSPLRPRPRPLS